MSTASVRTRILIISDTHGRMPLEQDEQYDAYGDRIQAFSSPLPEADVAIHCGDLTARSTAEEYERTFSMLRALPAPLKLVIPGNHDRALDRAHLATLTEWKEALGLSEAVMDEMRSMPDRAQAIVDAAAAEDNVIYLNEGSHEFDLRNGGKLRLYCSPMTPEYGLWAFQYPPGTHQFDIPPGIDVALTHGPPRDVLDTNTRGEPSGCPNLFDAVCRSRPKIHCFGHIHEAWGAQLVTWKPRGGDAALGNRTAAGDIDWDRSRWVDWMDWNDSSEDGRAKMRALCHAKCRPVDVTPEGDLSFRAGEQTLFVNAAIMDVAYRPRNAPWLVDVDLPRERAPGDPEYMRTENI